MTHNMAETHYLGRVHISAETGINNQSKAVQTLGLLLGHRAGCHQLKVYYLLSLKLTKRSSVSMLRKQF